MDNRYSNTESPSSSSSSRILDSIQSWLKPIPLFTRIIFYICVLLYLLDNLSQLISTSNYMLCYLSFNLYQSFRLITSTLFHVNILHLLFNMMAFIPLSSMFERIVGTTLYSYLFILFGFTSSLIALLISNMLSWMGPPGAGDNCTIGLSGIIFLLLTINCCHHQHPRSLYGLVTVPSKLYPWLILFVTSILFPQSSFVGHMGGILAGYLYDYKYLDVIIPSDLIVSIESIPQMNSIATSLECYVAYSSNPFRNNSTNNSNNNSHNLDQGTSSSNNTNRVTSFFSSLSSPSNNNNNSNYQPFNGQGRVLGSSQPPLGVSSSLQYSRNIDMSTDPSESLPTTTTTPTPTPTTPSNTEK